MYELEFGALVDRGLVREDNDDVARVHHCLGLALVADGMGGHELGEVASQVAADTVRSAFERAGGVVLAMGETERRLAASLHEANMRVHLQPGSGKAAPMGTTLVAAAFGNGYVAVANVGDSRCYLVRHGKASCLTKDHSYVAELQRLRGDDSAALGENADQYQNILTRCLGASDQVVVDTAVHRCEPGDVFVLCSDGLWGGVKEDKIARIAAASASADDACRSLVGAAWQNGGLDNIAVAVARLVPSG